MPELAVSFISVSVKDSSVCCWGTANRLFICFSSKYWSFLYNTIRSNLILTCCSPLSPTVGMAMSKRIYIYTHNLKGGKQPLRMQWTKKALGGPDLMRTFIQGSWMYLPNMIVIVQATIWGPDLNLIRKNNGYLQSNSWTIFWEIRACSSSTAHQWCSHIIPLLQVSSTHLTFI
jgi:hypothetical protein